ncbi:hypothetical protein Ancab_026097 [Ancistrocladus abbreviatus]
MENSISNGADNNCRMSPSRPAFRFPIFAGGFLPMPFSVVNFVVTECRRVENSLHVGTGKSSSDLHRGD